MKYRLLDNIEEIITFLINNLIWLPLSAIATNVISLILAFCTQLYDKYKLSAVVIIICLFISTSLIAIIIYLLKKNSDRSANNMLSKFRAKKMVAKLIFTDRTNINSQLEYDMDVLIDEVEELNRSIIWTGSTYCQTTLSNTNGNYNITDSQRKNSPHDIKITFDQTKKRGDHVMFTTNTSVIDDKTEMAPHYSFFVKFQIDNLRMHIVVPKGLIKNVKKVVYADVARTIVIERPSMIRGEDLGNVVEYTYTVDNPLFLHNYVLEWEFTK